MSTMVETVTLHNQTQKFILHKYDDSNNENLICIETEKSEDNSYQIHLKSNTGHLLNYKKFSKGNDEMNCYWEGLECLIEMFEK